uniref:Putative glycoprotein n=1 Tax=Riboviria sp. TaxID=2585031 RepID=A0A8B0RJ32_9VIRU|nr:putative glycoprotein [Riboviria sp.]
MQLILTLTFSLTLIAMTTAQLREIFPRYDVARGNFEDDALANLYDRGALTNSADINSTCDSYGCSTEFSHTFNFNAQRASGTKLTLTNNGLQNSTIVISVAEARYSVSLQYLYTIYPAYMFAGWASYNYEENNYNQCKVKYDWRDQVNARFEKLEDYVDNYRRYQIVGSDWLRVDYAAWGSVATKVCNHYWATTFTLCQRKTLVADFGEGIAVFKIAPETTLTMILNIAINDDVKNIEVQPSIDVPTEITLGDLTLSISPAGTIISPLANNYYLAHFQRKEMFDTISGAKWYKANSVPTISSISETITKYHSPNLFPMNAYKPDSETLQQFYFDKMLLQGVNVVKCGSSFEQEANAKNSVQRRLSKLRAEAAAEPSTTKMDSIISYLPTLSNTNPPQTKTYFNDPYDPYDNTSISTRRDSDCCIPITTESRSYITTLLKSFDLVSDIDGQYEVDTPSSITQFPGYAYPNAITMIANNLMKVSLSAVLSSQSMRIPYSAADGLVADVSIPIMQITTSSAGSYFNYEINYVGTANLIPVSARHINLLKRTISVTSTGTYSGTIAFVSPPDPSVDLTVCFGSNSVCIKPKVTNFLTPPQGAVQDPDTTTCSGVPPSFFSIIITNSGLLAISIIMIIVDIILGIVILILLIRIVPKTFMLFLLLFSTKTNALSYTAPPISNLTLLDNPALDNARLIYSSGISYSTKCETQSCSEYKYQSSSPKPVEYTPDAKMNVYLNNYAKLFAICHNFAHDTGQRLPYNTVPTPNIDLPKSWFYTIYDTVDSKPFVLSLPPYLPSTRGNYVTDRGLFSPIVSGYATRTEDNTYANITRIQPSFQSKFLLYDFYNTIYGGFMQPYSSLIVASQTDTTKCSNGEFTRLYMMVPSTLISNFTTPIIISDIDLKVAASTYRAIDLISRAPITYGSLALTLRNIYSGTIEANTFICNTPQSTLYRATVVLSCNGVCQTSNTTRMLSRSVTRADRTIIDDIAFYTTNAYYTRQGLYVPSLVGPIEITPYSSGSCTVGYDSNGGLLMIDYEDVNVEHVDYRIDLQSFKVSYSPNKVFIKPSPSACTGRTFVSDTNALLTCDSDCCLTTFDNYKQFTIMNAGDVVKFPQSSDALTLTQYFPSGNQRNVFCPASGCSYATMLDVYNCALKHHAASTVFLFYFVPIFLGVLIVVYLCRQVIKGFLYGFRNLKFLNPAFYADKIYNPSVAAVSQIRNSTLRRVKRITSNKDA